jgi:quercetin dioxygenase-like cupin family protein
MEIISKPDIRKYSTGDTRTYWKPKGVEFEVIQTLFPPKCKGEFHFHKRYREATLVIRGKVTIIEYIGSKSIQHVLKAGEMVVFASGRCHTTINSTSGPAITLTYKFLGGGKRSDASFIKDKYVCIHKNHTVATNRILR